MNDLAGEAFSAGNREAADIQLHKLGDALQGLHRVAENADMTYEQRQSVQIATVKLFEAFGSVDATMHGKVGVSYEEAALSIDENLQALKDISDQMQD